MWLGGLPVGARKAKTQLVLARAVCFPFTAAGRFLFLLLRVLGDSQS